VFTKPNASRGLKPAYPTKAPKPVVGLPTQIVNDKGRPCGLPAISVAHYGEQNGDAMRDPEMCFELGMAGGPHLTAFYYRND
jgi:hypothetical protein